VISFVRLSGVEAQFTVISRSDQYAELAILNVNSKQ
jgi:hypothetical protein